MRTNDVHLEPHQFKYPCGYQTQRKIEYQDLVEERKRKTELKREPQNVPGHQQIYIRQS